MTSLLFVAAADVQRLEKMLGTIRLRIRRARRFTTFTRSSSGRAADEALHDAERVTEQAIAVVGGNR